MNEQVAVEAERGTTVPGRMAGLALCVLLASLGASIANVGLPAIAEAFAAPFAAVQWVVVAYLLAATALIVGIGRLGDLVGRRRLLAAGLGVFTAASLVCAVAPTLGVLVAARAAQGLGAAAILALAMALVAETVPQARVGSAMGLLGTMSAVGTAVGPAVGGILLAGFGWRSLFLIEVPLGIFALAVVLREPARDALVPSAGARGLNVPNLALLCLALAAYALAMTVGGSGTGSLDRAMLAAAAGLAAVFAFAERRAATPLIRWPMFRAPAVGGGLATSALVATVMMATLVVGPFYLSRGLGLDAVGVGLVVAVGPLVAALTGAPAGRLVDRFGAGRLSVAGLAFMAAGSGALATLPSASGIAGYVASLATLTAGYAVFQAANNTAVMGGIPPGERGTASALLNLSRSLGLLTGATLMGSIFALGSGAADVAAADPASVAAGMRAAFAAGTGAIVLALFAAAPRAVRPASGRG